MLGISEETAQKIAEMYTAKNNNGEYLHSTESIAALFNIQQGSSGVSKIARQQNCPPRRAYRSIGSTRCKTKGVPGYITPELEKEILDAYQQREPGGGYTYSVYEIKQLLGLRNAVDASLVANVHGIRRSEAGKRRRRWQARTASPPQVKPPTFELVFDEAAIKRRHPGAAFTFILLDGHLCVCWCEPFEVTAAEHFLRARPSR
jgi:hypothetical protein